MARPLLPVAGPKRRGTASAAPFRIIPLAGALSAMSSPLISKVLTAPSPALKQPLPAPPPMPPALSRPRATATPPTLVAQGQRPLKAKTPRIKQLKPGSR
jgi:hypothetical protein